MSICTEAEAITNKDRRDAYGHPADDFARIAELWCTFLGIRITSEQVAICQILVKVGRLTHSPQHRDSVLDIAGYANCIGMIWDRDGHQAVDRHIDGGQGDVKVLGVRGNTTHLYVEGRSKRSELWERNIFRIYCDPMGGAPGIYEVEGAKEWLAAHPKPPEV